MMDEEIEMIKGSKNKVQSKKFRANRNTGPETEKHVHDANVAHKESYRQRCFSNTEKDYACLMIKNSENASNKRPNLMSENDHHSFSFEQCQNGNSQPIHAEIDPNLANNTTNYKYTKMLQDFEVKQNKDKVMQTFCKENHYNDNSFLSNSGVFNASPHVSMKSFNNMSNYVKNTFRKPKPSDRKKSFNSYSSYRKYELMDHNLAKQQNMSKTNRKKSKFVVVNLGNLLTFPNQHSKANFYCIFIFVVWLFGDFITILWS